MPDRFELPSGWEIYIAMVFLNFTEIPWAEASMNTKARRRLEAARAPCWGWRGSAQSWQKPFGRVVGEMESSSSGDGGRPHFGSQLFPVLAGKRVFCVQIKERLSLPVKAQEARPKGCFWL